MKVKKLTLNLNHSIGIACNTNCMGYKSILYLNIFLEYVGMLPSLVILKLPRLALIFITKINRQFLYHLTSSPDFLKLR